MKKLPNKKGFLSEWTPGKAVIYGRKPKMDINYIIQEIYLFTSERDEDHE